MKKDHVALTPPMGWNSWDCYGPSVNEEQLLGNAQYMAEHLKEFGWEYVCCDIQWSEPTAGKVSPYYVPFAWLTLDEYGRQLPAVERFPSAAGGRGFGPIAEKIHGMGLKFGIHIMRGVPRLAVHQHLPVKGTDTTCDKIASDASVCRWNTDMYGIDASKEGAQAYYDSLFELYASWGVDYVKVDDICNTNAYPNNPYSAEKEIEMIRRAIDKCGRPMVLSLSPGPAVIDKAWHLRQNANMWRITDDFWDQWDLLLEMFWRCEVWERQVSPGCWPDCDMLPIGRLRLHLKGFSEESTWTKFTKEDQVHPGGANHHDEPVVHLPQPADYGRRDAGQRRIYPVSADQPGDPGHAPLWHRRPPGVPHGESRRLAQRGHPGRRRVCGAVQPVRRGEGDLRLLGGAGAGGRLHRPGAVEPPGPGNRGGKAGRHVAGPRREGV